MFANEYRKANDILTMNRIRFVPELEEMPSFLEYVNAENLSDDTKKAATNLDDVISSLVKNFTEGTEYFKVMVVL